MFAGLDSLRAFAAAERLEASVNEVHDSKNEATEADWESLAAHLHAAVAQHAEHPEVEIQSGRAERLLWQRRMASRLEGIEGLSSADRWQLADPQVMTAALRSSDVSSEPLRREIEQDGEGLELARNSFQQFENALAVCPLDERAVWGVLRADIHWLTPHARSVARTMLSRLAGNNTQMLMTEGVVAVREGSLDDGVQLIRQAVLLRPARLLGVVKTLVGHIDAKRLMETLPSDPVFLAAVCRELATDPAGAKLADAIIREKLPPEQLKQVRRASYEGWLNLSWVAQRLNDRRLRVDMLSRAMALARDRRALRFEVAQAKYEAGMKEEAIEDLRRSLQQEDNPQYRAVLDQWLQSLDQPP
jgi:hypothetical protein